MFCRGGPFHSKFLELEYPETGTLTFTVGEYTGRYVHKKQSVTYWTTDYYYLDWEQA